VTVIMGTVKIRYRNGMCTKQPVGRKVTMLLGVTTFSTDTRAVPGDESFSSEDSLLPNRSRNRGTISASPSTATFSAGSTDSTIANIHKHIKYNLSATMSDNTQKELNILMHTPQIPDLSTGEEDLKKDRLTIEEPSIQDTTHQIVESENSTKNVEQKIKIKWNTQMVKMLMRADTHININVPGNEPRAKCTSTQVLAAISVSLGSMVVGFASAYTSPALASMAKMNGTVQPTTQEASWIGSLMPLSALIGGILGGPLIEMFGRKTTIAATAVPFIISWLLIALAVNVLMLYAARVIAGFCVGIVSLGFPVYLGETLQPEVRGMLGLLPTALGNVGILLCYSAGKYLDWSMLAVLGSCLPVPFLILMFFIPETPRWFVSK
ncbi:hypothetical protein L9F63_015054, partial [Diploptera punctata]